MAEEVAAAPEVGAGTVDAGGGEDLSNEAWLDEMFGDAGEAESGEETPAEPAEKAEEAAPETEAKAVAEPEAAKAQNPAPDPRIAELERKAAELDRIQREAREWQEQQQRNQGKPAEEDDGFADFEREMRARNMHPGDSKKLREFDELQNVAFERQFKKAFGGMSSAEVATELRQMRETVGGMVQETVKTTNTMAIGQELAQVRTEYGEDFNKFLPTAREIVQEYSKKGILPDPTGQRGPTMTQIFQQAEGRFYRQQGKAAKDAKESEKQKDAEAAKAKAKAAAVSRPEDSSRGGKPSGKGEDDSDPMAAYRAMGINV